MVQYAEIKELESVIKSLENDWAMSTEKKQAIYHLKKYHTILEGWYGDEQYHNKVEEGIEL